ncbi:MAG: LmbE family protein, partial [Bryobacteraceae bacterium]
RSRHESFDPAGLISLEVGGYQPLLGKSYSEIAAASRSMHKSQGFGVEAQRGERKEYFKFLEGTPIENGGIFAGVDTTWSRVANAGGIARKIDNIIKSFDDTNPSASLPALLDLHKELCTLKDPWAQEKLSELDGVIASCLGLHLEAVTDKPMAQPGEKITLQIEAINRSPAKARIISPSEQPLPPNEPAIEKLTMTLPKDLPYSEPYWLRQPGTVGTYTVSDQTLIGRPESPPPFPVNVTLQINDEDITYSLAPRFRKVDRVAGEVSEPLVIAPVAFAELSQSVFVFGNTQPKTISLRVIAAAERFSGKVALEGPAGWKIEPAFCPVNLQGTESETSCTFQVTPPAAPSEGRLNAVFISAAGDKTTAYSHQRIAYPHIEPQTLISPTRAKLVRAKIENKAPLVGYIPGAGDAIPQCLREIGSEVKILTDQDVKAQNLARFDAVVLGVRAYNVHPERIGAWYPELFAYARQGGVVVVQYNTTPGPKPDQLPHPLHVSHDRVTDETVPVRILAPEHPVMNFPNKITAQDFAGWVQERGLYFADQWDSAWTPILSSNDPGEQPLDGGFLVTRCGKGWFIYTGYSWFRELPAGVPGAYRIFANMISLGHARK